MKISLRKANALQTSINERIKSIVLETTVAINEFENVVSKIAAAKNKVVTNSNRRLSLYASLYDIRAKVAESNSSAGINARLTDMAHIAKLIEDLGQMISVSAVMTDVAVLDGKLSKIKNRTTESYGLDTTVSTGVFTAEESEDTKKKIQDYKKSKQVIADEILELNIRTDIELTDDTVTSLKAENLI